MIATPDRLTTGDAVMRTFDIATHVERGVTVLRVTGDLDAAEAPALGEVLGRLESNHSTVIDLSECDFLDSAGIAVIVEAWRTRDGKASLSLVSPSGQVDRIIRITGLDRHIALFSEVEEAVARMRRDLDD